MAHIKWTEMKGRSLLPDRLLQLSFRAGSPRAAAALHALLFKTALVHGELLLISCAAAAAGGHQSPDLSRQLRNFFAANGDDPSRWNAAVSSLSRKGLAFPAAEVLPAALRLGLAPDSYTLCSGLSTSTDGGFVRQLHCYARKSGWLTSVFVGGALIDAYANSGSLVADARQAFEEMPTTNVACANALLSGYRRCGTEGSREALALVRRMAATGLDPDGVTLSILLRICAEVPTARLGAEAHAYSLRRSRGSDDVFVASALVDMYGRCGSVEKARLVFDAAEGRRDVVLWTSMLDAYSRNGRFEGVIGTFQGMVASSVEPDEVAFVTVLSACSRTGDVARGLGFFESMTRDYRMAPWPEHCACVMDLLCRAGELEKAAGFAGAEMSRGGSSSSMWGALLSACRAQGNVEMGEFAAAMAVEVDPSNLGVYVEMSNLYAAAGKWEEMEKLREGMKSKGLAKDLGSSRFMATV